MRIKLLLIVFFITPVWAQSNPTLYVAAPNGLSLREGPGKDSKRIKLLEYGTAINQYTYNEDWETIDGYSGRWIKVSTHANKTGYIFDGYTLPFKPPTGGDITQYFSSIFGKIVFKDSIIHRSDGDDYLVKYIYHFSNGVIFMESSMYESVESTLINVNIGPYQAYLFYYLIEEYFDGKHHLLSNTSYPQKEIQNDTLIIQLNKYPWGSLHVDKAEAGPSYWVTISFLSGGVAITWGSGV